MSTLSSATPSRTPWLVCRAVLLKRRRLSTSPTWLSSTLRPARPTVSASRSKTVRRFVFSSRRKKPSTLESPGAYHGKIERTLSEHPGSSAQGRTGPAERDGSSETHQDHPEHGPW